MNQAGPAPESLSPSQPPEKLHPHRVQILKMVDSAAHFTAHYVIPTAAILSVASFFILFPQSDIARSTISQSQPTPTPFPTLSMPTETPTLPPATPAPH